MSRPIDGSRGSDSHPTGAHSGATVSDSHRLPLKIDGTVGRIRAGVNRPFWAHCRTGSEPDPEIVVTRGIAIAPLDLDGPGPAVTRRAAGRLRERSARGFVTSSGAERCLGCNVAPVPQPTTGSPTRRSPRCRCPPTAVTAPGCTRHSMVRER